MPDSNPFAGWETYPKNVTDYDALNVNIDMYRERLEESLRSACFVGDATKIKSQEVKRRCESQGLVSQPKLEKTEHKSIRDVESLLKSSSFFMYPTAPDFFVCERLTRANRTISPPFSFAKLPICEEALLKILTYYKVLPDFLDILLSFGQKMWEKDENFSIYHQYTSRKRPIPTVDSPDKSIVCYNLKYAMQRKDGMSDDSNSLVFKPGKSACGPNLTPRRTGRFGFS
ncbi:hypothetical protein K440DRAFT_637005 [Wilcoxina mikolae CBS 423.85]|nr:hypothetical protein K440DRAFT_637005 [Wilcoxina mikolae CBS 423.85]